MKTKDYMFIVCVIIFQLIALSGFACNISFSLVDSNGSQKDIYPGGVTELQTGMSYVLKVVFIEDHGRCKLGADETEFLLDEEKWKVSKDYLPLKLLEKITWEKTGNKEHETSVTFRAEKEGTFDLEVIRDCSKGGYDEIVTFLIRGTE